MNETDIVVVSLATGRHRTLTADSGFGDAHPRYSPDGATSSGDRVQPQARVQRSGPSDALRAAQRPHAALAPQARSRDARACTGRPTARRSTCSIEDRGRHGLFRLRPRRRDCRTRRRAGRHDRRLRAVARRHAASRFDRATLSHPPALFAVGADGRGERPIEIARTARCSRAHALGATREFTVKGWGGEPGAGVGHLSAELRSAEEVAAAALDPRRPARRASSTAGTSAGTRRCSPAHGYVVVGVNYHGSSGFGQQWHRVDHRRLRREGIRRHRSRDRLHAARRATSTATGWSRPAAATAATWSRT